MVAFLGPTTSPSKNLRFFLGFVRNFCVLFYTLRFSMWLVPKILWSNIFAKQELKRDLRDFSAFFFWFPSEFLKTGWFLTFVADVLKARTQGFDKKFQDSLGSFLGLVGQFPRLHVHRPTSSHGKNSRNFFWVSYGDGYI